MNFLIKILLSTFFLGLFWNLYGQFEFDSTAYEYSLSITKKELNEHLSVLASDEFEGRKTGTLGQKKSANYIKEQFIKSDIEACIGDSGFFQEFNLFEKSYTGVSMKRGDKEFTLFKDFYYLSDLLDTTLKANEVIFAGYGIKHENYDDYNNIDVLGKVVIAYAGEPRKNKISLITGDNGYSEWSDNINLKLQLAADNGAVALLLISKKYNENLPRIKPALLHPRLKLGGKKSQQKLPLIYISEATVKEILNKRNLDKAVKDINANSQPYSFSEEGEFIIQFNRDKRTVNTENVLGCIRGSEFPEEVVVLTAHYDHLGIENNEIYNGADDDGSGTSAIMEIGEAFAMASAQGNGPKRSILIMAVSGEEMGLLGSRYYSDNPIFKIENTVANLNIDMIGRTDFKYQDKDEDYIYLIGSDKLSSELHQLSERTNTIYSGLELDYTYNADDDPNRFYYRSDHYNFARLGIPVIFYFRGIHADYHKPSDTIDKIEFDTIEKVARLIFFTAWNIANSDSKLKVDSDNNFE